jgi:hypothetical protein
VGMVFVPVVLVGFFVIPLSFKTELNQQTKALNGIDSHYITFFDIDPWLTDKSPLCPICKHDCLPADLRKNADLVEQNDAVQLGAASPFNTPSAAAAAALASTSTPAPSVHSPTLPDVQDHTEASEEPSPITETSNHEQHTDLEVASVDHENVEEPHMTPPHTPQDTDAADTERHPVTQ